MRQDAVAVLAYDPPLDAVCVIQQFRAALIGRTESPWSHELVAGLVDISGESVEQVARRELEEEAGIQPLYLEQINSYWQSIGGSNERMNLFLALASLEGIGGHHGVQGESEDILALVVARDEALDWARTSGTSNASSIIALQWLESHRQRLISLWQNCQ